MIEANPFHSFSGYLFERSLLWLLYKPTVFSFTDNDTKRKRTDRERYERTQKRACSVSLDVIINSTSTTDDDASLR